MKHRASLGYYGPEWNKKIQNKDNPHFWKYGVANLIFLDLIKNRKRILDIGCGTGGSTLFLAECAQIDYVIGIDPVKSMIQVAKRHAFERNLNSKTDFLICDGRYLPFKQSRFDALVSRGDAFVFLIPQEMPFLSSKEYWKKSYFGHRDRQRTMEARKNYFLYF
jgi:SAM-dependent methyltransferase